MSSPTLVIITIVAFVIGYLLVSWFMRSKVNTSAYGGGSTCPAGGVNRRNSTRNEDASYSAYEDGDAGPSSFDSDRIKERHYGKVLGLQGSITKNELRKRYLEAIARYHPDKVNHLAPEFQAMAEEKSKAIIEAYDYFRIKYGLR